VMLAIALAPAVPTALATARTSITNGGAKLNEPVAEQSCGAARQENCANEATFSPFDLANALAARTSVLP
jgi:hypothetical protein